MNKYVVQIADDSKRSKRSHYYSIVEKRWCGRMRREVEMRVPSFHLVDSLEVQRLD